MENFGYIAAAYAVVLVTLGGYAWLLLRRERRLRWALEPGANAPDRRAG